MKPATQRNGFTLIEVVIAAAIIVSIFSILYGTYFAVSESTKTVRAKQKLSQHTADMMTRLARQIRCSYAGNTGNQTELAVDNKKKRDTKKIGYFYGNSDHLGEILHLITTNSFFVLTQDSSPGLLDVGYKLDRNEGVLYISQSRFTGSTKKTATKEWVPIADNVREIQLEFFDGAKWSSKWIYNQQKKLPSEVKIDIVFENQTGQTYECSTSVNICCGAGNKNPALTGKLAVAKN